MADSHELEGVRSKDHARRWNIISDMDTLVAQPRKQRKHGTKAVAEEVGTGSFREFQWPVE